MFSCPRKTIERVKELLQFGGFSDCDFLRRTLAKEFQHMESRYFSLRFRFLKTNRFLKCYTVDHIVSQLTCVKGYGNAREKKGLIPWLRCHIMEV